ncbi:MAG: amino acid ABC transporter permease [Acholeplasmataceae bacterium]
MIVQILPPKSDFLGTLWYLIQTYHSFFIRGILITLLLSIVGTLGGFVISLFLTTLRQQSIDYKRDAWYLVAIKKIGIGFAKTYITVFRGTPMIVQAMIFYYGLAPLRMSWWNPLAAGLIVVTLNTAAYIAEVIRSGINGIDVGQMEAARSLGFSERQGMYRIVLPQAIRHSLPAIGNEFIVNLKDTAVLSVIGVFDLFKSTQSATSANYRVVEGFFIAAVIYLILTMVTAKLVHHLETRTPKEGENFV